MPSLREFLLEKGYCRARLQTMVTNHLEIKAQINGVEGSFILDTGASNSCVDFSFTQQFKLEVEHSEILAAGAGGIGMPTELSKNNFIKIGKWKDQDFNIVLFDLSHVNQALRDHNAPQIHGILGADILNNGRGVIDYKYKCVYLK